MDNRGEGSRKKRVFEGIEPRIVVAVLAIASALILIGWSLYYSNHIEGFSNGTQEAKTQTEAISEWLKYLLNCQFGTAALFVSLSFVVIRLSTSAFSIRVFKSIFSPPHEKRQFIWGGVIIYCFAVLESLILVMTLSFQVPELPDLKTFWGFWAVPLLLIHCVIAFEILCLFFARAFRITQSDHIIETELNRISSIYDKSNGKRDPNRNETEDKKEVENSLQLISNVINSSIQQYDTRSSEYGVKHLSEKMDDWIKYPDTTKSYVEKMTNSAKVALLRGDEITAICTIEAIDGNVLKKLAGRAGLQDNETATKSTINPTNTVNEPEKHFLSHMALLIKSYSNLSQFSVEKGYVDSTFRCVKSLETCNNEIFTFYKPKNFKFKNLPQDTTKRNTAQREQDVENWNLYDLSTECIKFASVVSQIAAQNKYETLVVMVAGAITRMHKDLSAFLRCQLCLSESIEASLLPKNLIYHYIWSIKDAGVSAANNSLEWGAIKYIESLEDFGGKIFELTTFYHNDDTKKNNDIKENGDIASLAKSMTHTSTSIREIGQQLAAKKFQEGTIKAIFAIKGLANKALTRNDMMWIGDNHIEDNSEKQAFVRATWNIKDIGRSAAENGIEKAVVRVAEVLFELLEEALKSDEAWRESKRSSQNASAGRETPPPDPSPARRYPVGSCVHDLTSVTAQISVSLSEGALIRVDLRSPDILGIASNTTQCDDSKNPKKTEALLRLGESFYEVSMKTKHQDLQEALTKIIYYSVLCVRCLDADTKEDYDKEPVQSIYLKTFVQLKPVGEFSGKTIQTFLKTLTLDQKLESYGEYDKFIQQFSEKICKYCSEKSPQQLPDPGAQTGETGLEQEPCPHEESVQNNESHEKKP